MAAARDTCSRSRRSARSPTRSATSGVDRVRLTGGEPLLRRDLPSLIESLAARPAIRDLALTTNGVLLRAQAAALRAAGPAPHHGQPRHARPRALPRRSRASTSLDAVLAGIDAAAAAGFDVAQARHGRHPRRQRRRARGAASSTAGRSAPRCASSSTWTSAARRAGAGRSRVAARDPRRASATHYGAITPIDEAVIGARRALPAAGRHDLRHHLVDDRAVLRHLRPQPAHRRRRLAAVPLCQRRHRPAPAAARRRDTRRAAPPDRAVWSVRADRGAEERAATATREPFIPVSALKKDAHLEMHTGGDKAVDNRQSPVDSHSRQSLVGSPSPQSYLFSVLKAK